MGQVALLQRGYVRGVRRDQSRDGMPSSSLWDSVDYIPGLLEAPLRKRGGWRYSSQATAGASPAIAVAYADFSAASQLLMVGARAVAGPSSGKLFKVDLDTGATTSVGNVLPGNPTEEILSAPVLHRDWLVVPFGAGGGGSYLYNGAAVTAGILPLGRAAAVYKDRSVLAGGHLQPQRVYFGPDGPPNGVWDTATSYIDASFPVKGLAAMRNVLIVFGANRTERIRGSTPPPDSDMVKEPLFDVGCIDARTIVSYGDNVLFANEQGIWLTDGTIPENLAQAAGFRSYWADLLSAYTASWTLAAGLYRGLYVISVMDGTAFVDALALDITARTWFRLSNLTARMFARTLGTSEDLHFALADELMLARLAPIFDPSSTNQNDGDGTPVLPVLETPFYKDRPTLKRWERVYLSYLLDAPSTAATLQVGYITSPEQTVYTSLAQALPERGTVGRERRPLRFRSAGVAFKVSQLAASADTRIHELEAEAFALEGGR